MESIKYDLFSQTPQAPGLGRTLYLLGTSGDGPVNEPTRVRSRESITNIFGNSSKGNLVQAAQEAFTIAGGIDLYLVRITGQYAMAYLYAKVDGKITKVLTVRSKYAGAAYNNIKIKLDPYGIFITQPDQMQVIAYYWADFPLLGLLAKAINEDTTAGHNTVYMTCHAPLVESQELLPENLIMFNLTGGDDGLNCTKNQLFLALEETYGILESSHTDIVVPLGVYFDDVHPQVAYGQAAYGTSTYMTPGDFLSLLDTQNDNQPVTFHGQLIDFCKRQLHMGVFAHGVLGFRPVIDLDTFNSREYDYITRLLDDSALRTRYGIVEDRNFEKIDYGYFISLVAGEIAFNADTPFEYYTSGAVAYGSLLAGLPLGTSPTNQPLAVKKLRYEFTDDELRVFADMGVVAFRQSTRKGIVVSSGVTASLPDTDMHFVVNIKCVQAAVTLTNQTLEGLMGEPLFDVIKTQEIDKRIERLLQELVDNQILTDYSFNISYSFADDSGVVDLSLQPRHAIEKIRTKAEFSIRRG